VLARKTAVQHQDNRCAFVTTNGCFSSKATKDPRFRGGETTAFQRKTVKINQTLGLLGIGGDNKVEQNVDAKSNDKRVISILIDRLLAFPSAMAVIFIYGTLWTWRGGIRL
jgi:hypothetical protein